MSLSFVPEGNICSLPQSSFSLFHFLFLFYYSASAGAGACMTLSSWSTTSMEEVAAACGHRGLRWFQLYLYKNPKVTTDLIKRAERAGYKALVVTVDTPILGRRLADARNKFNLPPYLSLANFNALQNDSKAATELVMKTHDSGLHQYTKELIDDSLDWGRVDWLCGLTRLPVILKGILTGEDAKEATRHGVKGIVVSNHGARQLDGVPATVRVRKKNGVERRTSDSSKDTFL